MWELGGASSEVLRRPEDPLDTLRAARRSARGSERRRAEVRYATGLMFAAQGAARREARQHRRSMVRALDAARRGNRDEALATEIDLLRMWDAWRAESRAADRLAERFARRHSGSWELVALSWMVRGELAFQRGRYRQAIRHYRYGLGRPTSPYFAFALLRTAQAHTAAERPEEARQALEEVAQLGCPDEAGSFVRYLSSVAASELGTGMREDPDGRARPESCPPPASEGTREEEGWRPAE